MNVKKYSSLFLIPVFIIISLAFTIPSPCAAHESRDKAPKKQSQRERSADRKPAVSKRGLRVLSKDPYRGAIVIDAATGSVLFEDNADFAGYPASMVKLMTLLIILEAVATKHLSLQDEITVSAEAAKIGGSQVYLKEKEVFTVDALLYALIVQSANDSAVALALHYSGSKKEFVHRMNIRAQELGMKDTVFHSVHGLPPGKGQLPDVSTPRDMVKLCREVLKYPRALKYTSTKKRLLRADAPEPFIMWNHNHLIGSFEGCDGLKTGYFRAAGFSIAATAARNGNRIIAVIFGSVSSEVRDAKARELLSKSLTDMAANPPLSGFRSSGSHNIFE